MTKPTDQTFLDLQAIARELIEAFALTYTEDEPGLANPLMRWIEFRERHIDQVPREVVKTNGFDERVPEPARVALAHFEGLVRAGADLNPYLSRRQKKVDTSGTKRQWRTDGLWADWAIHHAHLTTEPIAAGAELSTNSDWLLFFLAFNDVLALIDVRPHNEPDIFQAKDLVEKAFRSWPDYAERFRMNMEGLSSAPDSSPAGVYAGRKGGLLQVLEIDGKVYLPPGMGMTSASTPARVSLRANDVVRNARVLMDQTRDPDSWIVQAARARGIQDETFRLVVHEGKLARYAGGVAWQLPREAPADSAHLVVQDALIPQWSADRLEQWRASNSLPPKGGLG